MRIRSFVVTAVAAATVLLGAATPASATTASATGQPFARQAVAAKLTPEQAKALRTKVDGYLKTFGGRQVSLNEIELDGGHLRVVVPGESQPRDLSSGSGSGILASPCGGGLYTGWFCAYSGSSFTGDQLNWYNCVSYGMPWGTTGSWKNNQYMGTRARFYNGAGGIYQTTPGAYSYSSSYSWLPIYRIRPC